MLYSSIYDSIDSLILQLNKCIPKFAKKPIEKPIFIIGTGRCGSTLLNNILKSNKKICVYPTEANKFWHPTFFPYSPKNVSTPPILIDPKKFTDLSIASWPKNHAQSLKNIFSTYYYFNLNKDKFIVKSAMISFMIPKILSTFSDAKFIHIFRNGVSVANSLFIKEWPKYSHLNLKKEEFIFKCATYWMACIEEIDRQDVNFNLLKQNKMLPLSYESLCSDPTSTIKDLARFIGCDRKDFKYNLSHIKSTNYKVESYRKDPKWKPIFKMVDPIMKKKGYNRFYQDL